MAMLTLVFAVPGLLGAAVAGAQETQDTRQILIEKAREREQLFDGYDLAGTAEVLKVEQGEHITGAAAFRSAVSGERFFLEGGLQAIKQGKDVNLSAKAASDGQTVRLATGRASHELSGTLMKHADESLAMLSSFPTPGGLGITGLLGFPGSLSEILDPDSEQFMARYGDRMPLSNAELVVTARENALVSDRECVVIDCAVFPKVGVGASIQRLYFDPALNYACVRMEGSREPPDEDGKLNVGMVIAMDDFREVKPGLFIPFSVDLAGYRDGEVEEQYKCKIEALEFPQAFDDGLFTFDFAPGTRVWDRIANVFYTVGETVSLGELEEAPEVESEEAAESPAPAPETAPAEGGETPGASEAEVPEQEPLEETGEQNRSIIVFIIVAVCMLAIAAAVVLRKRRG